MRIQIINLCQKGILTGRGECISSNGEIISWSNSRPKGQVLALIAKKGYTLPEEEFIAEQFEEYCDDADFSKLSLQEQEEFTNRINKLVNDGLIPTPSTIMCLR